MPGRARRALRGRPVRGRCRRLRPCGAGRPRCRPWLRPRGRRARGARRTRACGRRRGCPSRCCTDRSRRDRAGCGSRFPWSCGRSWPHGSRPGPRSYRSWKSWTSRISVLDPRSRREHAIASDGRRRHGGRTRIVAARRWGRARVTAGGAREAANAGILQGFSDSRRNRRSARPAWAGTPPSRRGHAPRHLPGGDRRAAAGADQSSRSRAASRSRRARRIFARRSSTEAP